MDNAIRYLNNWGLMHSYISWQLIILVFRGRAIKPKHYALCAGAIRMNFLLFFLFFFKKLKIIELESRMNACEKALLVYLILFLRSLLYGFENIKLF